MDFKDIVENRTAIGQYEPRPVPDETTRQPLDIVRPVDEILA